jgi:hypothetical protein
MPSQAAYFSRPYFLAVKIALNFFPFAMPTSPVVSLVPFPPKDNTTGFNSHTLAFLWLHKQPFFSRHIEVVALHLPFMYSFARFFLPLQCQRLLFNLTCPSLPRARCTQRAIYSCSRNQTIGQSFFSTQFLGINISHIMLVSCPSSITASTSRVFFRALPATFLTRTCVTFVPFPSKGYAR